ncbi:MAG: hypothetical protein ACI87J_000153 [Colwellia sp.]
MPHNKLFKRTLNSWLASFLAILANNFSPLNRALGAINVKKLSLIILLILIPIITFVSYRGYEAIAPLKAIYGSHLSIKLSDTKIYNSFYEPIVICGSLYESNGVEREFIAWGDGKERWVHIEGKHTLFQSIKGTVCK